MIQEKVTYIFKISEWSVFADNDNEFFSTEHRPEVDFIDPKNYVPFCYLELSLDKFDEFMTKNQNNPDWMKHVVVCDKGKYIIYDGEWYCRVESIEEIKCFPEK